jgi:hypothetical protein
MTSRGWAACGVPFLFSLCYPPGMRRPWEPKRLIRDRNDLVELIADAVQLYLHQLSDPDAKAVAECVLQVFKMEGLSIRRRRTTRD